MSEQKTELEKKWDKRECLILAGKILGTVLAVSLFIFLLCHKEFYCKNEQILIARILWPLFLSVLAVAGIWVKNPLPSRGNTISRWNHQFPWYGNGVRRFGETAPPDWHFESGDYLLCDDERVCAL